MNAVPLRRTREPGSLQQRPATTILKNKEQEMDEGREKNERSVRTQNESRANI